MKHLKKAKGRISQNIEYNNENEDNSRNILSDKILNHFHKNWSG